MRNDAEAPPRGRRSWNTPFLVSAVFLTTVALLGGCDSKMSAPRSFPAVSAAATPNDTIYNDQWALPLLSAREAWGIVESQEFGDSFDTAVVAVLDTMFDLEHPDLAANLLVDDGWDFTQGTEGVSFEGFTQPADEAEDHGTHVAGIVAAVSGNGLGVSGIGYSVVKVLPLRVLEQTGPESFTGSFGDLYSAMRYAGGLDNVTGRTPSRPANVISMSLGAGGTDARFDEELRQVSEELVNRGISIVAAAGNQDTAQIDYPAAYPGILAIGSVDVDKGRSDFSNYGGLLDFVGPGGAGYTTLIESTVYDGGSGVAYDAFAGTSMATPYVAGVLGLMYAYDPGLNAEIAYRILAETAEDLGVSGRDDEYGWGLVNADRVLRRMMMQPYGPYALSSEVATNQFGPIRMSSGTVSATVNRGNAQSTAPPVPGVFLLGLEEAAAEAAGTAAVAEEMALLADRVGAEVAQDLGGGLWRFRVPESRLIDDVTATLESSPLVAFAGPDRTIFLAGDRGPRPVEYERLEGGSQSGVTTPSARLFSTVSSLQGEEWLSRLPEERRSSLTTALEAGNSIVVLFAGQRPTGGYSLMVDEVVGRGETLFVDYHVTEPSPGELVTQALTSPYAVLLVQGRYSQLETREG